MPKITQRTVNALVAKSGETFTWDSELRGFGVRTKPSGTRTYLIQYRRPGEQQRRHAFAQHPRLTASEARAEARQLLAGVATGSDPSQIKREARGALSVADLCDEYHAKAEAGEITTRRGGKPKKPSTLATDRGRIERHIKPLLGRIAVRDLTALNVRTFIRDITSGKTATDVKTGLRGRAIVTGGEGTAARTAGLLGGILSFAVEQEYRADNPCRGVRRPADQRKIVHVTDVQWRALGKALDAAEHNGGAWQAVAAIKLLALTGCRRGEIEKLRWQEVDEPGSCFRFGDTKTGASVRPIGRSALKILKAIGARSESGPYVLPGIRVAGSHFAGLPKAWDRIVVGDRIKELTPHGLRHAFASRADDLGCSLPTISALLGHSSGTTTTRYVHKLDSALLQAADRVSRSIDAALKGETGGATVQALRAG